jgi:hypothetical protein
MELMRTPLKEPGDGTAGDQLGIELAQLCAGEHSGCDEFVRALLAMQEHRKSFRGKRHPHQLLI